VVGNLGIQCWFLDARVNESVFKSWWECAGT